MGEKGEGVDQRGRLECSHDDIMFIMCVLIAVLVEEHPITERLRELERAMDSGLRSERAELRRQVKEQFAIPDIDMTTVSEERVRYENRLSVHEDT